MPRLAEQELKIRALSERIDTERLQLTIEGTRLVGPIQRVTTGVGAVLLALDTLPALQALTAVLFRRGSPAERRRRVKSAVLDAPKLLQVARRISRNRRGPL